VSLAGHIDAVSCPGRAYHPLVGCRFMGEGREGAVAAPLTVHLNPRRRMIVTRTPLAVDKSSTHHHIVVDRCSLFITEWEWTCCVVCQVAFNVTFDMSLTPPA